MLRLGCGFVFGRELVHRMIEPVNGLFVPTWVGLVFFNAPYQRGDSFPHRILVP